MSSFFLNSIMGVVKEHPKLARSLATFAISLAFGVPLTNFGLLIHQWNQGIGMQNAIERCIVDVLAEMEAPYPQFPGKVEKCKYLFGKALTDRAILPVLPKNLLRYTGIRPKLPKLSSLLFPHVNISALVQGNK